MKAHIWVIEVDFRGEWEPTTGTDLKRRDARAKRWNWQFQDPYGKYRVKKYVREVKP